MAKTHCYSCGTTYEGSNCPTCSIKESIETASDDLTDAIIQQAAEQAEAVAEAADQIQQSIEDATHRQRQNIADSWKLQSSAQAKRASELYETGLVDEALIHATEAIRLDHGNIEAYRIAQRVCEKKGAIGEAKAHAEKQIRLLKLGPFKDAIDWHCWVLRGLPNETALLRSFSDVAIEHANHWRWSEEAAKLLEELLRRRLDETAKAVLDRIDKTGLSAARFVLFAAYSMEARRRTTGSSLPPNISLFAGLKPESRLDMKNAISELGNRQSEISAASLADLSTAAVRQYNDWWPEIGESIRSRALAAIQSAQKAAHYPAVIAWIVCTAIFSLAFFTLFSFLKSREIDANHLDTFYIPIYIGSVLALSISVGVWLWSSCLRQLAFQAWTDRLRTLIRDEVEAWHDWFESFQPGGATILEKLADLEKATMPRVSLDPKYALPIAAVAAALLIVAALAARPMEFSVGDALVASRVQGWKLYKSQGQFRRGDSVCSYVEALNVARPSGIKVDFQFTVVSPSGITTDAKPEAFETNSSSGPHLWASSCLPLSVDAMPGEYRMRMSIHDRLTGQSETLERPFTVVNAVAPKVRLPEVTTQWFGRYSYRNSNTDFELTLTLKESTISGLTSEMEGFQRIPATINGSLNGGIIEFTKKYDRTGKSASYQGDLNDEGTCATGTWIAGTESGSWVMSRDKKANCG